MREAPPLTSAFSEYDMLIKYFYQDSDVSDDRVNNPSGTYRVRWRDMLDIVGINTALISDGEKHCQILDIDSIVSCGFEEGCPGVVIGHHGMNSLFRSHRERFLGMLGRNRISAYLHGDWHKYANTPIANITTPNTSIPEISCAKSAPQSGDSYSDIGVVYYEWRDDGNTYVQAYEWSVNGFRPNPTYMYNVNRMYYFPMLNVAADGARSRELCKRLKTLPDYGEFMLGDWVSSAEELWETEHYEGLGSFLLFYYTERSTLHGDLYARSRAISIYEFLRKSSVEEDTTEQILIQVKELLNLKG